jgi:hypothetical protein
MDLEMSEMFDRYHEVLTGGKITRNDFLKRIIRSYMSSNVDLFKRVLDGEVIVVRGADKRIRYVGKDRYNERLKRAGESSKQ